MIMLGQDSSDLPPGPLLCYDLQRRGAQTNNRSGFFNKFINPVPVHQCQAAAPTNNRIKKNHVIKHTEERQGGVWTNGEKNINRNERQKKDKQDQ